MYKSLSEHLDALHAKGKVKTEKMPDLMELIESRNEEPTKADLDREKRGFQKFHRVVEATRCVI